MRIADGVFLIASGDLGLGLTHPLDCHAYAVECDGDYWLIDAGVGLETEKILAQLRADSIPAGRIRALLLTHYHLDHAGGAAGLREALGVSVYASRATAQAVESGDERANSLDIARQRGLYPPDCRLRACPVARTLADGERIEASGGSIEALATPGHSADMTSFVVRRQGRALLFSGDTVFHGGRVSMIATWDCNPLAYAASIERLASLNADALFPGHGLWSLENAQTHLDTAMGYVRKLLLPPNL
jgi:glyoxylase-like metal-dependent hydrolase (beta-lactamase superfamily II)